MLFALGIMALIYAGGVIYGFLTLLGDWEIPLTWTTYWAILGWPWFVLAWFWGRK